MILFATPPDASSDPAKKPTAIRQNPMGPGLRWDRPPGPRRRSWQPPIAGDHRYPGRPTVAVRPTVMTTPADGAVNVQPGRRRRTCRPYASTPSADPSRTAPADDPGGRAVVPSAAVPPVMRSCRVVPARPPTHDPLTSATATVPPPRISSMRQGSAAGTRPSCRARAVVAHRASRPAPAAGSRTSPAGTSSAWKPAGEATFAGRESDYHLSSDGALVARLTRSRASRCRSTRSSNDGSATPSSSTPRRASRRSSASPGRRWC